MHAHADVHVHVLWRMYVFKVCGDARVWVPVCLCVECGYMYVLMHVDVFDVMDLLRCVCTRVCNEREASTIDNAVTKLVRVMPTHIYIYMHADNSGINVTCVFTNMHRHVPAAGEMKKIRTMTNY